MLCVWLCVLCFDLEVVAGCVHESVGKGMERLLVRRLPSNESGKVELYRRRRQADIHMLFTCFLIVTLHSRESRYECSLH
jgi:hypothetical protein